MKSTMGSIWITAARPKTLVAAVMPVLLGSAFAYREQSLEILPALICLCFAILVQVGTNYANDYYDGVKGTDTEKRIGPQRAVASGQILPNVMLQATLVVLAVAFLLGLSLIYYGGWWLLPVGLASIIAAVAYTGGPYPLGYHGWGDVFVVIFFGLVAVPFTYYVQMGSFAWPVFAAGLGMGLVINNILVVNNYRDLEEDRQAGKRTLIVRLGRPFGFGLYIVSYLVALLIPVGLGLYGILPLWISLLVPVAMALSVILNSMLLRRSQTAADYLTVLGQTAKSVVFYGLAFSIAVVLGSSR